MSMRFATAMDRGAVMELHSRCFGSSPAYMKIYYQQIFKPEHTFVFTEGERIRSSIQMLPVKGKLNRKDIKGGLLYAAMTAPAHIVAGIGHLNTVDVDMVSFTLGKICMGEDQTAEGSCIFRIGFKGENLRTVFFGNRNPAASLLLLGKLEIHGDLI